MASWDVEVFTDELNVEFLEQLVDLDEDDILEAIEAACRLAAPDNDPNEEELANGNAAATIAAIWAGAPFSAGEAAEEYPFIREMIGTGSEALHEAALEILEDVDEQYDVEVFIEALS
ncbi:Uncharacterised protein [Corynebacterium renale]|uniref:DUF4259 domain-containing protein n=1 Tax=Corynebacterium renale TaxID=1724 RepID=A0A2A9DK18_9CORY|nr:hypothetical protein [Corynebacterium renale]PFG27097.1 hypothetical protein ATK06_0145 [Corynebacterium renale]SQG64174.1 Uncharacterised protein [Corynebacterium renale]SQI24156.1 Uncharacterised protein [Corynebacterium renale]